MIDDIKTIIWKEWNEVVSQQGGTSQRTTQLRLAIIMLVFGIFIPWRMGPSYVNNPLSLIIPTFVPIFAILGTITDSFAGERERHTLETLLASRMSDEAILLGKVICGVVFAWMLFIAMLIVGLIGVNATHWQGHLLLFPANRLITTVFFNFLISMVFSSAGVLVSLRAPTVRQAMQMLTLGFMFIVYGGIFGFQMLPIAWRASIRRFVLDENLFTLEVIAAGILLGSAIVLFTIARFRFQRARLILD